MNNKFLLSLAIMIVGIGMTGYCYIMWYVYHEQASLEFGICAVILTWIGFIGIVINDALFLWGQYME